MIPFCYLAGFLFKDYGSGQLVSFFFHFLFGGIISLAFWVMRLIPKTRSVSKTIAWILRIVPSYAFGSGVINLSNRTLYSLVEGYKDKKNAFSLDISGGDILYLGLEGVIFFLLTLLVEKLGSIESITKFFSDELSVKYVEKKMDPDVM
jgi:ATP-binding cassette subfamily A (ABC1) protein 3